MKATLKLDDAFHPETSAGATISVYAEGKLIGAVMISFYQAGKHTVATDFSMSDASYLIQARAVQEAAFLLDNQFDSAEASTDAEVDL